MKYLYDLNELAHTQAICLTAIWIAGKLPETLAETLKALREIV